MATAPTSSATSSAARPGVMDWLYGKFYNSGPARRFRRTVFMQPRPAESGEVTLVQRRVFIIPTQAAFLLALMLLALIMGSINYYLSLGYALTFLVVGIGWIGMLHTFRNMAQLRLRPGRVEAVFSGDIALFQVVLANPSRYDRYAIMLHADQQLTPVCADISAHSEATLTLPVTTGPRGWFAMPRATLETRFPLGLWRAWSYWQPDLRCLVYPVPAPPGMPLPPAEGDDGRSGDNHSGRGSEDFAGIRNYAQGDSIRHLAWKAMARNPEGGLLSKAFEGGSQTELWLDLGLVPGHLGTEAALSVMVRWVLDCEERKIRYGLRLPGTSISPDLGEGHRERCLTALALFGVQQ